MTAQELYSSVTNEIVHALESGNLAPWRQRWTTGSSFLQGGSTWIVGSLALAGLLAISFLLKRAVPRT